MKIAYIDHYDSFTFNLIDWILNSSLPIEIDLIRFDSVCDVRKLMEAPIPIIISPGPKSPRHVNSTVELVDKLLGKVPILGVCLGHQILGEVLGFETTTSKFPCHGDFKELNILHKDGILNGIDMFIRVAAYHSLVIQKTINTHDLAVISATCKNGEIMCIEYKGLNKYPAIGIQFHPESFLSVHTSKIRENFLKRVNEWWKFQNLSKVF